jgi:hypothetical protein
MTKKVCGACRSVYYCNTTCQRAHWSVHKLECAEYVGITPREGNARKYVDKALDMVARHNAFIEAIAMAQVMYKNTGVSCVVMIFLDAKHGGELIPINPKDRRVCSAISYPDFEKAHSKSGNGEIILYNGEKIDIDPGKTMPSEIDEIIADKRIPILLTIKNENGLLEHFIISHAYIDTGA